MQRHKKLLSFNSDYYQSDIIRCLKSTEDKLHFIDLHFYSFNYILDVCEKEKIT